MFSCYYFDDIIKIKLFDFNDILLGEKSCGKTWLYDISNKSLIWIKPLHIKSDKVDGYIAVYKSKSGIAYVFSRNYAIINIDSYHSLHLEKQLAKCYNTH